MIIMYLNPHQASCDLTRRVFLLDLLTQFQPNIKKPICTIQYVKKKGSRKTHTIELSNWNCFSRVLPSFG